MPCTGFLEFQILVDVALKLIFIPFINIFCFVFKNKNDNDNDDDDNDNNKLS